jgi:hypothetical protein
VAARTEDSDALGELALTFENLGQPLAPLEALAVHFAKPLLLAWAGKTSSVQSLSPFSHSAPLDEWLSSFYICIASACLAALKVADLVYSDLISRMPRGDDLKSTEPDSSAVSAASSAPAAISYAMSDPSHSVLVQGRRLQVRLILFPAVDAHDSFFPPFTPGRSSRVVCFASPSVRGHRRTNAV